MSRAWPKGLKDLEAAASSRRFGLELTWKELLALAKELRTPVDIRLDGWERVPKVGDGPEVLQMRVEVLDASLFRVAARERRYAGLFQRLHEKVVDVRALVQRDLFSLQIGEGADRRILRHENGLALRRSRLRRR